MRPLSLRLAPCGGPVVPPACFSIPLSPGTSQGGRRAPGLCPRTVTTPHTNLYRSVCL